MLRRHLLTLATLWICAVYALAATNVTTWRNDLGRTGQNLHETTLTPANVNTSTFGKLYSYPMDGQVYTQPLYMSGLMMADGPHNVIFVATEHDSVYALDADHSQQLWRASLIDTAHGAPSGATTVPSVDLAAYDVKPEYGITSTPVIDPGSSTIYLVANSEESGVIVYRLHALDLATGNERPNSPVVIQGSVAGTGGGSVGGRIVFQAKYELNRPALLLLNGQVVIAFGSHSDNGPYHGWVMAYDATSLQQTALYNESPNGSAGGIWMSGAGLAADTAVNGRIYFSNGNGSFNAAPPYTSSQNYGDAVERLDLTSSGLQPMDAWTPFDHATLDKTDLDQGSGGVLLLPDQPGSHVHELIQAGKNGKIELLDRDNLGAVGTSSNNVVQEITGQIAGMWSTPAYWNGNVYFWSSGKQMLQYRLSNGLLSTSPIANSALYGGYPSPSPVVSANGTSSAILWAIRADAFNTPGPAVLLAYDATNIGKLLYSSDQSGTRDAAGNAVKFSVPTVVNGRVYLGTQNEVDVYGLLASAQPAVPTPTFSPAAGTYPSPFDVTISDSLSSAIIYDTTDGTIPTTASNQYSGPIHIDGTTTLQALAVAQGYNNSSVARGTFTIGTAAAIDFSNGFSSVAGLTLNGNAVNADDTRLQLTTGGTNQAGSVFWNTPVRVQSFSTDFNFQLSGSGGLLADGFTFTVQNDNPNALGPIGAGLGYGAGAPGKPLGIPNSVAVKFDLWNNDGEGHNSTGVYTDGASPTVPSVDLTGSGLDITSGDTFSAHISYDGKTLYLTLHDLVTGATAVRSFPIDIPKTVGGSTGYVGFTAGSGGVGASQKILSWTYTPDISFAQTLYQSDKLHGVSSGPRLRTVYWSEYPDGAATLLDSAAVGDSVIYTANIPAAGAYDLQVTAKAFNLRAIWQLAVDGVNTGAPQDEFYKGEKYVDIDVGPVFIKSAGNHTFRFTAVGKNAASTDYKISVDSIGLTAR